VQFELLLVIDGDADARLDLNEKTIISLGGESSESTPSIALVTGSPGTRIPLRLRYVEKLGEAQFQLMWRSLADGPGAQFVPVPTDHFGYVREIGRSPRPVVVNPGSIDATTTEAAGDGLMSGVAGDISSFIITVRDSAGNKRFTSGSDTVHVSVEGTSDWALSGRVNDDITGSPAAPLATVRPLHWDSLEVTAQVASGSTTVFVSRDLRQDIIRGDVLVIGGIQVTVAQVGEFSDIVFPIEMAYPGPSISSFSENATIYAVGIDTGSYLVEYRPIIRGNYGIDVSLPAIQEMQAVTLSSSSAMQGFVRIGLPAGDGIAYSSLVDVSLSQ